MKTVFNRKDFFCLFNDRRKEQNAFVDTYVYKNDINNNNKKIIFNFELFFGKKHIQIVE